MTPDEKADLVKRLYGTDGGSMAEIAGRVSAHLHQRVSRNSIASLYLRNPNLKQSHPFTGQRMDKSVAQSLSTLPRQARTPRPKKVKLSPPSPEATPEAVEAPRLRCEPVSLELTLLDLGRCNCRWPTSSDPIRFCGRGTMSGSSYCTYHHKLSWLPVSKKGIKTA